MKALPFAPFDRDRFTSILQASCRKTTGIRWESTLLEATRPHTLTRVEQIVASSMRKTPIAAEVRRFVQGVGGVQSPALWDLYFGAYDRVVGFSPDYIELVADAAAALPLRGPVLDLGAGTGNFTMGMHLHSTARQLYSVDMSLTGLRLARQKVDLVQNRSGHGLGIYQLDLRRLKTLRLPRIAGAVMNNVLYSLAPKERERTLKEVARLLQPGGTFVLSDPTPQMQDSAEGFADFISQVCAGAYSNDSQATEFDYALITYMNHAALVAGSSPFLAAGELKKLVAKAGLKIFSENTAYYGHCTFLVLKKSA